MQPLLSLCASAIKMYTLFLTIYFLSLLNGVVVSWTPPAAGPPCFPPPGYLPRSCRLVRELSSTELRLPAREYGVNVCRVTSSRLVTVYNYHLQRRCGWAWHYYYHIWQCLNECVPSGTCSNTTRVDTRSQDRCCRGFIPRPPQQQSFAYLYYSRYFTPAATQPTGCPLAQAPTLYQCLQIHNLTSFLRLIDLADLTYLFNLTDGSSLTIFGPPNSFIDSLNISTKEEASFFIGHHIVPMDRKANTLTHTTILTSANRTSLHVSTVDHYYYMPFAYRSSLTSNWFNPYNYQYYQQHQSQYILLGTDRFVSGAMITVHDACSIDKGSLHLVAAPLAYSPSKLSKVLQVTGNYSLFVRSLEATSVTSFLDSSPSAHTLFAPTDSAFAKWPSDLWECLMYFDRPTLNSIVLYHIGLGADYYNALRQRRWIATRLNEHIQVFQDTLTAGNILLTDDRVPIVYPDIPASDGVIHGIDTVLIPPRISFGECQRFATPSPSPSSTPSSANVTSTTLMFNFSSVIMVSTPGPTPLPNATINATRSMEPTMNISMSTTPTNFTTNSTTMVVSITDIPTLVTSRNNITSVMMNSTINFITMSSSVNSTVGRAEGGGVSGTPTEGGSLDP